MHHNAMHMCCEVAGNARIIRGGWLRIDNTHPVSFNSEQYTHAVLIIGSCIMPQNSYFSYVVFSEIISYFTHHHRLCATMGRPVFLTTAWIPLGNTLGIAVQFFTPLILPLKYHHESIWAPGEQHMLHVLYSVCYGQCPPAGIWLDICRAPASS